MKELFMMYFVGYADDFKKACNTGWGCGYVMIPKESNVGIFIENARALYEVPDEDNSYTPMYYCQLMPGHEGTYFESKTVDGREYFVLGWDTAHTFNGPQHDFDYVFKETKEMLVFFIQMEDDLPEPHLEDTI